MHIHHHGHSHGHNHGREEHLMGQGKLMRYATIASVSTSLLIVAMKFFAWIETDSLAVLSSVFDALMDVLVSFMNFIAIRYALQPPDKEHRYGHGKAEDIAALMQTAFIVGSAFFILVEALGRFINPADIRQEQFGINLMLASTVVVIGLVIFQRFVVYKTKSTVIMADSYHYFTDILSNGLVIVSLYITSRLQMPWVDTIFAVAVAFYIFFGAWKIGKKSFNNLMDHELEETDRQKIKAIVNAHNGVKGLHDLRTRASGIRAFIQMNITLDGNISLSKAHDIADELEKKLEKEFPNAEVIIHQEPIEK